MKKIKKIIPYLINSLLTLFIFLIVLKISKIYPFGNKDIAVYDAYYQYKPMLYNFITSIKNGTILSFNFLNGLGNPTIFNYLYYLASPINLIALLFNNPNSMFISVIIAKLLITTFTSTFYFKKKTNNNFISTICTISYFFSGWFISYNFHIMWLDSFMIFPLLQYGIEELINNDKNYIYIFSLAYTMITNFYMAFMICIYIFIYYMYNIITKKDKYINKIKNFQLIMFSTIIACLLSAFTIYATYSSFLKMGINISNINTDIAKLTILDYLKTFFPGNASVNIHQYINNIPNICLNTIFVISFLYYFINNEISIKEKIKTIIALAFMTFVLFSNKMNYFLNCFHYPAGYSFRYSFIISFYLLIIFLRNYKTFNNKIDYKIYFINFILLITLLAEYTMKNIEFNILVFNITFLLSYTIFLIFYNKNKYHNFLFLMLIVSESIIGFYIQINKENYIIKDYNYSNESYSYRVKTNDKKTYTDITNVNLYSNQNTIETFSSMQYNSVLYLLNNLGCATDLKATIYSCNNTKLFNMLFNIKDDYTLQKIYSINNNSTYSINTNNLITNQNNLIEEMTSIDNIIEEKKLIPSKDYFYKINEEDEYIITINPNIKYIRINNNFYTDNINYIPEIYYVSHININTDLLRKKMLIYNLKKNDYIEVSYHENPETNELTVYTINEDKLNKAYKILNSNSIEYTQYKDNLIEGEINVSDNQVIFTSIPYDTSWYIEIDGEETNPIMLYNSLLGIEASLGKHKIKIEYKNNFKIPIIISISTFIILLINLTIKKIKKLSNS